MAFFRMWWEDEMAFSQENLNLLISDYNFEGEKLQEFIGIDGVQNAIKKMRKVWREKALELGQNKKLNIPEIFL